MYSIGIEVPEGVATLSLHSCSRVKVKSWNVMLEPAILLYTPILTVTVTSGEEVRRLFVVDPKDILEVVPSYVNRTGAGEF